MIPFIPFVLQWWRVIALAAVVAAVSLYVANAEHNRGLVKLLESRESNHLTTIAHQDEQIRALSERIKANNSRWLEMIQREQDRYAKAKAEADRIKAQRDTITAELAVSRRDWQEALADDPELYTFSRLDVPYAVWDRMRNAAGQ